METVDILYAVAELRSDYCPRLELKVTLGQQVTCITILHLTDSVFHVSYQGIIPVSYTHLTLPTTILV